MTYCVPRMWANTELEVMVAMGSPPKGGFPGFISQQAGIGQMSWLQMYRNLLYRGVCHARVPFFPFQLSIRNVQENDAPHPEKNTAEKRSGTS